MSDETNKNGSEKTRRAFVRTATQVALTAPAVNILLNARAKASCAQLTPYEHLCLDDFTFGSNEEDIDALSLRSNFNFVNRTNNQDDVFVP